jgi:phosphocarrier protein
VLKTELTIVNKLGLHARAAVKLVELASSFSSDVFLVRGGKRVSGKSIMGVMMLAAARGVTLELIVDGVDEQDAMERIVRLVQQRFGEDE